MRPHPARRRPTAPRPGIAALLALGAVGALACSDGPLDGPGLPGRGVSLRLEPRVEPRASVAATGIGLVRVSVTRIPDGLVVLDSVVGLGGPTGAELGLDVPLASTSDRFAVRLAATDAAGDTIFRATDTTDVVRGTAAPSLELLLRYAGPDTAVARIVAGPDTAMLDAGASAPLWVVGYRTGETAATPLAHVAWRSGDETVVAVSRTGGRATGIAPGRAAWVYATSITGLVDSTRVVVRHVLAALDASPASLALAPGGVATVAVAGRAPDGTAVPADAVAWTSSDSTVAVVDEEGTVVAIGTGSATVTATSGGAMVAVPVAVALPQVASVRLAPTSVSIRVLQRAQLVATPLLADGSVARDRPIAWTTSDAAIATVGADGVVSGAGVGVATVTATVGGRSASVEVEVSPLPVDDLVASPSAVQLAAGESLMLAATVTDAAGQPVPNTPIAWSSSNAGVALVSSAGQLTAVAPGTATVTAAANGRASTIAVTVLPVPVDSVLLSRTEKFALVVGTTADLDATPLGADGTPLRDRVVSWSSTTPSVATVDADGGVVAVAPGKAHLTATVEGVAATVKVDVLPVPVASVQIPTATIALSVGGTFQLRADAYDSLGLLLPGRAVTWTVSDASVATVADGLVSARRGGVATVTATVDGKTATATVTVTESASGATAAVAFAPAAARAAVGQTTGGGTVALTAERGTTTLQLASWDGAIASVQPTVTVSGTAPAEFTVTGLALGTTTLQGTASVATMGTVAIEVVAGRLRAEGWAGATILSQQYRRIRIYPAGADGATTDAVFAGGVPLTVTYDDRFLEVHLDAAPSKPVGPADDADRAGSVSVGTTVTPAAGQPYVSLVLRGKNLGFASLSIGGAVGAVVALDLTGLPIL